MNIHPTLSSPERPRDKLANYDNQPFASDSSRSSTPSSDSPPHSSRLTTPRPEQDETQSAAALALLGLSMRTSSEAPSTSDQPPSPAVPLGGVSMKVTLSSASESEHSSTGSTGSDRMSSMKKRRSSESSGQTEDTGRSKRTRGSEESNGSPPTPKAKTDGWTEEMKRVYEQAAFALPPSGREQRRLFGDMRGRNEQLGLWVTLEIGTYCGRKRISSHSQTLKNHHATNPELKKFLTTDSSCNPVSPSDPAAWPLRLKQLVHAAYSSLPNPPPLVPAAELDLANIAIPAIPVRILRKDGVEVEMTLPDAIEYDKADQRMKNREKKPMRGRPGKKSRTADPGYSRGGSQVGGGRAGANIYARSTSSGMSANFSPGPSIHSRAHSNNVHREVDRHTRYRQYSHTNADLPPYHGNPINSNNFPGEVTGPAILRPAHSSSAPAYWDAKARGPRYESYHPPQSSSYPLHSNMPPRTYHQDERYDDRDDGYDDRDDRDDYEDDEDVAEERPHHPGSLDFILAKPVVTRPTPTPSPTTSTSTSKRTFWKS